MNSYLGQHSMVMLCLLMASWSLTCMAAEPAYEYADDVIVAGKPIKKITTSRILYPNDILVGDYLITDEAIPGRRCILEMKSGKYIIPSSVVDLSFSDGFLYGRVDARDEVDKKWNLGPVVYFSLDLKMNKVKWFKDRERQSPLPDIWNPE